MTIENDRRQIIASRIRGARELAGLTQAQAAKLLGMQRTALTDAESGKRKVSGEEISQMAKVYEVSADYLLGQDTEKFDESEERLLMAARILKKLTPEDRERLGARRPLRMAGRMTVYIGIDPGLTGALATVTAAAERAQVWDLKDLPFDANLVDECGWFVGPTAVLIELPDGRPGRGVSKFTFNAGRRAGYWDRAAPGRVRLVNASVWTSAMGVGRDKEESLELARTLWPNLAPMLKLKKHHNRAQALLIAEYGRRSQL